MKSLIDRYTEALDAAFGDGDAETRIKAFARAMMIRAEMSSREQIGVNDTPLLHALRGQNTILFELSDWAVSALAARKAQANAGREGGIPEADDV